MHTLLLAVFFGKTAGVSAARARALATRNHFVGARRRALHMRRCSMVS